MRKVLIAEEALTYNAAKPTVDAIEQLVKDESQLNRLLEEAYTKVYGTEAEFQSRLALLTEENARGGNRLTPEQLTQRARALIEDKIKECVNGTVDTFKKRAARLDKVMQTLDKRIGLPERPVSSLRLHESEVTRNIVFLNPLSTCGLRKAA